jgi:hypothetical protein
VEALSIFGKASSSVLPEADFLGDFSGGAFYWRGWFNQKILFHWGKTLVIQFKIWHSSYLPSPLIVVSKMMICDRYSAVPNHD